MTMKKTRNLAIAIVALAFVLVGCSCSKPGPVDYITPNEEGYYQYENPGMGFKIMLPKTFEYYQTQRWDYEGYSDLEILVPSGDPNYKGSVPGYATPVTIRVYDDKNIYDELQEQKYITLSEKRGKLYTVRFWEEIPADWQDKWNSEVKKQIIERFSN